MADEVVKPTGAAPAAVIPVNERVTVPVSALFSEDERTLPAKPAVEVTAPEIVPPATPAEVVTPEEGAVPVKPAGDEPVEQPAAKPAGEAPKPAEDKIKIGDKEYTRAELEKELAKRAEKPAEAAPVKPAAEAPKPPTAEETTAEETTWQQNFVKNEKVAITLSTDEVETILSGGEEAAKLLNTKLTDVVAKAVMLARKSVYADMNPALADIQSKLNPVVSNAAQVEAAAAEQQFIAAFPDFKSHMDTVRQVGEALLTRYPNECAAMSREQLLAEVASQSDRLIQSDYKKWNPAATNTWRDAVKAAKPADAVPAKPAAPAKPADAVPAKPAVQAPAANSPAAITTGGQLPDWHKSTAKDLQG